MATPEEIERRIDEVDVPRSTRRVSAAKRISELAIRRMSVAAQLSDLERELGDLLAESSDILEISELAEFTDIPAADLARWLNDRKTARPKRKRPPLGTSVGKNGASLRPSTANMTAASPLSTQHEPTEQP